MHLLSVHVGTAKTKKQTDKVASGDERNTAVAKFVHLNIGNVINMNKRATKFNAKRKK